MDEEPLSRLIAVTGPAGSSNAVLAAAVASVREARAGDCAVILVEGISDRNAIEALAVRQGRNLSRDGVFVVPMGGATNIGHFLDLFGPAGLGVRLAGPAQRARTREQQLRRFFGSRAGRKARYGRVLADALDLSRLPSPLDRVLARV